MPQIRPVKCCGQCERASSKKIFSMHKTFTWNLRVQCVEVKCSCTGYCISTVTVRKRLFVLIQCELWDVHLQYDFKRFYIMFDFFSFSITVFTTSSWPKPEVNQVSKQQQLPHCSIMYYQSTESFSQWHFALLRLAVELLQHLGDQLVTSPACHTADPDVVSPQGLCSASTSTMISDWSTMPLWRKMRWGKRLY